jgi:hypothetical protein
MKSLKSKPNFQTERGREDPNMDYKRMIKTNWIMLLQVGEKIPVYVEPCRFLEWGLLFKGRA